MDGTALESIEGILLAELDRGLAAGTFPCGVVALRRGGSVVTAARGEAWPRSPRGAWTDAGATRSAAGVVGADARTVFDLASLTKIVATLPATLLTVQAGRIGLDDPASRWLPELSRGAGASWNGSVTIRSLLGHYSGLPAWRPYFVLLRDKDAYLRAIADESASYAPGKAVEYSDLGFMSLGWILERAWDEALPELVDRLVLGPLGMSATGYPAADPGRFAGAPIAPTEVGNEYERSMALAYAEGRPVVGGPAGSYRVAAADVDRVPWRRGAIFGEAHDGNCHYGLGGVSGHAGLFSTADDLVRYLAFWDRGGPLDPALRAEAFSRQTPPGAVSRGLGWILDGAAATHTGFTGTMLRYRAADGGALVALTNRVHPAVEDGIGDWRQALVAATEDL